MADADSSDACNLTVTDRLPALCRPAPWQICAAACAVLFASGGALLAGEEGRDPASLFLIEIVDQTTGRGVPCVRLALSAPTGVVYTSDSAGRIVLQESALLGHDVHFAVLGDGYILDPDRPHHDSVTIRIDPGGSKTLRLQRTLAAERLYRSTGLDPYWHSRRLNLAPSHAAPLRAQIVGQDSAYVARYGGQLFWIWGDTIGLGPPSQWNYEATAAVSPLPHRGKLAPSDGVDFEYFLDEDGFVKPMVAPEDGGALTWLDGLTTLEDDGGRERLFALYVQMRRVNENLPLTEDQALHPTGAWWTDDRVAQSIALKRKREIGPNAVKQYREELDATETFQTRVTRGIMEYRPATRYFHGVNTFPAREIDDLHIGSHAIGVPEGRPTHIVFSGLAPNRRVAAHPEAIVDIERYESFTCFRQGVRVSSKTFQVQPDQLDRDSRGRLRYRWRGQTSPVGPHEQAMLVEAGHLEPEERWIVFRDVRTGRELIHQHHSLQWNPYRQRYAGLFTCRLASESRPASTEGIQGLNQTWYGEADTLLGPWAYLEKVVDVGDYAYYNPLYNPYFHEQGGRILFFEGTYTRFMDATAPMRPRDNYNQVVHRLDLDDPRVTMPVAVYAIASPDQRYASHLDIPKLYAGQRRLAFFAPDRPRVGCVPIYESFSGGVFRLTAAEPGSDGVRPGRIAFYALPAEAQSDETATMPLYRVQDSQGGTRYVVGGESSSNAEERQPICRVWPATSRYNPFEEAIDLQTH